MFDLQTCALDEQLKPVILSIAQGHGAVRDELAEKLATTPIELGPAFAMRGEDGESQIGDAGCHQARPPHLIRATSATVAATGKPIPTGDTGTDTRSIIG
eukprot:TRINITY_DN7089_c0_g1_i2.p4 TRINITY_DN7089_c0_g1~~TRINITY_DN7089_c0_g1_i2.p4  ORF type:complete len:100 (-),score=18.44 TRINITY_DN7089_c0_g1_i2:325-624(-)